MLGPAIRSTLPLFLVSSALASACSSGTAPDVEPGHADASSVEDDAATGVAPDRASSGSPTNPATTSGPEAGSGGRADSGSAPTASSDAARDAMATPSSDAAQKPTGLEAAPAAGYWETNIYPGNPPNFVANAPAEKVDPTGNITNVSVPTLRRWPVDRGLANGQAWIVFPGGAYVTLDMGNHAGATAFFEGRKGIIVFGLKYRVAQGSTNPQRDALLDAKRAVRYVRSHAAELGIDPTKIGVVGYSAGSHLALMLDSTWDKGDPAAADPVERLSSRPDYVAVNCPWNLGMSTSTFAFTAQSAPVFIDHAKDDTIAPIAMSYDMEKKLMALKVPVHLEVYASGGHGAFNMGGNATTNPGYRWPDKFIPWLQQIGAIP
jgi:endo-1,4-beta-xylanase